MRWAGFLLLVVSPMVSAFKMEAGTFTLNDTFALTAFTSVTLQQTYDNPPLIFILPTDEGGDPSDVRVKNVTITGFETAAVEPPGNDGQHVPMTVDYIAIDAGSHQLADGTRIQAGSFPTQTLQRQSNVGGPLGWDPVVFPVAFGAQAMLLAQIQTMANEEAGTLLNPPTPQGPSRPWLSIAVASVTASGFNAALERAEAATGSVTQDETFAWMAVQAGVSTTFDDVNDVQVRFDSFNTGDRIDGWDNGCDTTAFPTVNSNTRVAVASKIKRDGSDGGWVRRCSFASNSIGLTIDEDIARDSERSHTTEDVSVLVFDRAFVYDSEAEPDILFMKLVERVVSDPINLSVNPKAIPEAVVEYRVNGSNQGNGAATNVVMSDEVPTNSDLFVGDLGAAASGPIGFSNGPEASGLTYNYNILVPTADDLEFSEDEGATWGVPTYG